MSNPVDQKLSPTAATESVTSLPDKEISTSSLHTTLPLDVSNADRGAVFGNSGALNKFYRPIDTYEGIHRFDPEAEWTEAEEKKIVRKIDYRICSWCCLMFFALQLDRGNISQALSDNMLGDLGLSTNDFNLGQTLFYICFLCAELPSQLMSKWLGPDNWIPIQMTVWSIVACSQAKLSGKGSFLACRCLLGLIEGGFIPDVILYLSYFYKTKELPFRLSLFWTSYTLTQIASAFLAFGILRLRGVSGMEGWRWLFALEGGLTVTIGLLSFFYMPASPTQTKGGIRGKDGWFSEREEVIMVNRILRDDPSKGDMHNRDPVTLKLLWQALQDYDMWPLYLIGLTWMIPSSPMTSYLTLTLKSLGFDTFTTNLLTIPASVLFIILLILVTWLSEMFDERLLFGVVSEIGMMAPLIALALVGKDANKWGVFTACTLLVGYIYVHAILVSLTSRNAGSVRTRTVGSAVYNMCVQASSIIGSNIYRESDKPLYHKGNKVLIGIAAYNAVLFIAAKLWYIYRNKSRDQIWNAMTTEQKQDYLINTKDVGNKRLDFRFAH